MSDDPAADSQVPEDPDVVIVGGGPAGCSVGVFTARYGLDTVIFDRGRSSLRQCAHLENYLGFPGGIDVETFYALAHDHAEAAGCEIVPELVDSVDRAADGDGFVVRTDGGRTVQTDRVVAAARYDGTYLRPLSGDEMFVTERADGEEREYFDREYADADGRTPIEGLYVASPVGDRNRQAIIAAGHGAAVGQLVVADVRRDRGYWEEMAERVDWARRESAADEEWLSRDRWREYFDERVPDDVDRSPAELEALREAEVDERLGAYVSDAEIERRRERAHDRVLEHLDTDRIRAYLARVESDAEAGSAQREP